MYLAAALKNPLTHKITSSFTQSSREKENGDVNLALVTARRNKIYFRYAIFYWIGCAKFRDDVWFMWGGIYYLMRKWVRERLQEKWFSFSERILGQEQMIVLSGNAWRTLKREQCSLRDHLIYLTGDEMSMKTISKWQIIQIWGMSPTHNWKGRGICAVFINNGTFA